MRIRLVFSKLQVGLERGKARKHRGAQIVRDGRAAPPSTTRHNALGRICRARARRWGGVLRIADKVYVG